MKLPPPDDGLDPQRRKLLKGAAAAGAATAAYGMLSPGTGTAQTTYPLPDPTPYLEPFLDPLTIPPVKAPTMLYPHPGACPCPAKRAAKRTSAGTNSRPSANTN